MNYAQRIDRKQRDQNTGRLGTQAPMVGEYLDPTSVSDDALAINIE